MKLRKTLFKSYVWSVLLYGSEAWIMEKKKELDWSLWNLYLEKDIKCKTGGKAEKLRSPEKGKSRKSASSDYMTKENKLISSCIKRKRCTNCNLRRNNERISRRGWSWLMRSRLGTVTKWRDRGLGQSRVETTMMSGTCLSAEHHMMVI